jgi:hypothetical protein
MLNKKAQYYGENIFNILSVSAIFFISWGVIGVAEYNEGFITEILNLMLTNGENQFWVKLILPIMFFSSLFIYIMYIKGNLNE